MTSLLRAIKIQNHSSDNTALLPMRVNPPRAEPDAAQLKEKLPSLNLKGDVSAAQISAENEKSPSPQDADAFSVVASGADSGYGSTASTPQENKHNFLDRTSVPVSVPQVFDKPISDDQRDRFFDFRYQYNNSLWKAISKGNKKPHPGDISMKLKYMGSDEESAKLFIVIQCEKRVAKRVRHFFAQEHIQQDLKPDFEVYILDKGVIRLSTEDTLDVSAHLDGRVTGEIIEVFGLTASHPVEEGNDLGRWDDDDFDSEEFTDTDSISELNESDAYPQPSHSPKLNAMTSIGKVAHDSLRLSSTTSANHDWALIKLNTAVLPNLAPDSHPPSLFGINLLASRVPLQPQQKIDVVVMTSHGLQKGSLVSNGSSIMMFPGRTFLQTLDLVLRSDSELRPGDSGSWVVSETTHEVYGHVISVDALGEAHLVPLESTLSDIRAQLDVDEVALPTKADLELSWTETPKITGDSAMPMGDYELGQDHDIAETRHKVGLHGLTQEKQQPACTIREITDSSDSALSVLQPVLRVPLPLSALAEQSRQFAKKQNEVYHFRKLLDSHVTTRGEQSTPTLPSLHPMTEALSGSSKKKWKATIERSISPTEGEAFEKEQGAGDS
ncbi:hypothetical protein QC761_501090 [Podospora bellae-mahoneyi]|uniref:Uncharacterized protein n=1 Tax=Podospora bellae-mahoneyi TaxID=2093777 RepID=A0ABR0FC30_9PEZI|nr:hypothetical protein QC761_501090 [Podospora bellae-mahoneyi]